MSLAIRQVLTLTLLIRITHHARTANGMAVAKTIWSLYLVDYCTSHPVGRCVYLHLVGRRCTSHLVGRRCTSHPVGRHCTSHPVGRRCTSHPVDHCKSCGFHRTKSRHAAMVIARLRVVEEHVGNRSAVRAPCCVPTDRMPPPLEDRRTQLGRRCCRQCRLCARSPDQQAVVSLHPESHACLAFVCATLRRPRGTLTTTTAA
jgi:hypothetical protein